jgi:aminoglycoside phosphotransferase (APT) family kinase protein
MQERRDSSRAAAVAGVTSSLLAELVLGTPQPLLGGHGNENWLVEVTERFVVCKIARAAADPGKLRAAWFAHRLVQQAGVPTGRPLSFLERCEELEGRPVRLLEFVEGDPAKVVLSGPDVVHPFFTSVGETLAGLHGIPVPTFTSRVDGSAPGFEQWADFVSYRLDQVIERARGADVFSDDDLRVLVADVEPLANLVSPVVTPALTHRDLYLDNLLSNRRGDRCSFVDWDNAEAWDPVVDLVKLRWQVFNRYPGASDTFWRAYRRRAAPLEMLRERLFVVDVLELVNTISNARRAGWARFEAQSRRNLRTAVRDFRS